MSGVAGRTFRGPRNAAAGKAAPSDTHDFLIFRLGGEQFAVDIGRVRECVHYRDLTAVMDGPQRVPGVMIWRGMILPWIDLRVGWCDTMSAGAPTDVIVFTLGGRHVAVAVDAALEVIVLTDEQITPLPPVRGLIGMGTYRQCRLYVFDVHALLSGAGALAPEEESESRQG